MRKFTLTLMLAIIATISYAQKEQAVKLEQSMLTGARTGLRTPVPAQKLNLKAPASKKRLVRKNAPRKPISSIDDIAGKYITANWAYDYDAEAGELVPENVSRVGVSTTITKIDENTIGILGLIDGATETVTATVDFESGTFTIPANQLLVTGTSFGGDIVMTNVSDEGDFTGKIYEDGLEIDQLWCGMISGGQYDGFRYSSYYSSFVLPANGTMTFAKSGTRTNATVLITQPEDSYTVSVWNFGNYGFVIDIVLKEDNGFSISSQLAEEAGDEYGDFYFYGLSDDEKNLVAPVTGTGTATSLPIKSKWTFYAETGYWYGSHSNTTIKLTDGSEFVYPVIEDVAATPAQPTIVTVRDYNPTNGYGAMFADVPVTDVNGNMIKESKLYYAVYTRIGEVEEQYVFTPEEYENLTENMTEIPYSFNDGYDFNVSSDGYKLIYFNHDYSNVDYFGIQSIYYGGDECNKSEISWYRFRIPTVEVPENLQTKVYTLTGTVLAENEETGEKEEQEYTSTVYVGIDGSDFYIKGLNPLLPEAWLKGSIDGTTVTIPSGQYYGPYATSSSTYRLFFVGLDTESEEVTDFIFDYDTEADSYLSFNAAGIALTEDAANGIVDAIYPIIILNAIPDVPATPSSPYDLNYNPWEDHEENEETVGYASVQFKLDATDDEGNAIIPDKLYYVFYSEIKGVQAPVVFTKEYYLLLQEVEMDELVLIPYVLDDGYDFDNRRSTTGYMHVFFNDPVVKTYEKIGIRSIYTGGTEEDEPQASEIVWLDIKEANGITDDGIATNIADKKVVNVTYTDLSGRRVGTPRNGVYVKTITFGDGSTRTVKSLVK